MLTRRQILRADPATVPLEEYTRVFGQIHISKMPKEDEDKKLRYLTVYGFSVFARSSIYPAGLSLLSVLLAPQFFQRDHSYDRDYKLLSLFWPPAANEVAHVQQLIAKGIVHETFLQGLPAYMAACSATSLVWLLWLAWRFYRDVRDRGGYIPAFKETGQPGIEQRLILIALFCVLLAAALLLYSCFNLSEAHSLRAPNVFDNPFSYTFKKCLILSYGYWMVGLASALFSLIAKNSLRLERTARHA
ncbi:hypothetical protein [Mesorhizobium sp. GbtcB19]|uniref:hypothetical protein n=1 Tax=Mesorhizobium sp. GbtcB19 TaxID=2824764 RepID=UPI001C2F7717|nr:hypothetical protein [Mesorhizobium sp. GbtcB19]